jgi:hypothetical protein
MMLLKDKKKTKERVTARSLLSEYCEVSLAQAEEALQAAISRLQDQQGVLLSRDTHRVSVWCLEILGKKFKVRYDRHRKEFEDLCPMGAEEVAVTS